MSFTSPLSFPLHHLSVSLCTAILSYPLSLMPHSIQSVPMLRPPPQKGCVRACRSSVVTLHSSSSDTVTLKTYTSVDGFMNCFMVLSAKPHGGSPTRHKNWLCGCMGYLMGNGSNETGREGPVDGLRSCYVFGAFGTVRLLGSHCLSVCLYNVY
jgi:hypothetical protein